MRSVGSARCGEVNRPVRRPAARNPDSIIAQVEPLPLVPATWTERMRFRSDALGGLGEMRRSEQAGAAAGGSQSGFDHRAGGAFAIGAGDVDRADAVLGAAERFKHGGDAIEAELGGL